MCLRSISAVSSSPDAISLLDSPSAYRHPYVPFSSPATYSSYSGVTEVESIRKHRGTTVRDLEYLVKWVGYVDPTWEPQANMKGSSNELLGE